MSASTEHLIARARMLKEHAGGNLHLVSAIRLAQSVRKEYDDVALARMAADLRVSFDDVAEVIEESIQDFALLLIGDLSEDDLRAANRISVRRRTFRKLLGLVSP